MAKVRAVKFCTQVDYIKSFQTDDKSPSKGTLLGYSDTFCMRTCGLRKIYTWLTVNWVQQCHWLWTSVSHTLPVDVSGAIHWGLGFICLICHCICCKLGCIIFRQQIDQVEFEHYCSNMCNNRHLSVCAAICYRLMLVAW